MYQLRCAELVHGCRSVLTGVTEDRVLAALAAHLAEAHGLDVPPEPLWTRARALVAREATPTVAGQ